MVLMSAIMNQQDFRVADERRAIMTSIKKRGKSYLIGVSNGYSSDGKQIISTMTWKIPKGMSDKQAKKEVNRQAVLFAEKCANGAISGTMKFDALLDQWFAEYVDMSCKASTKKTYHWLEKRTREEFGHLRLDKITVKDIQKYVKKLHDLGKSTKTIKDYVAMISSAFRYATKNGLLSKNPCSNITYPRDDSKEREILTIAEAQHLLLLLQKEPDENLQYVVFMTIAIYTGLRRGELFGLEWKDFDFEADLVSIRRAAYQCKALGHYTDTPKTKAGRRTLKLSDEVMNLLVRYRGYQKMKAESLADKWHETDRLFTAWNGLPMHMKAPEKFYKAFYAKHNLKSVTLHSLRHLNASILINAGLDVKTVQTVMGHSSATTTLNIYTHEFQTAKVRASEAVSNTLSLGLPAVKDK